MKRILISVIAVVLSVCLTVGAAAEFDLSSFSVDELNELIIAAQNEILAKGGDVVIQAGKYTVGVDIGVGSYDIKYIDESLYASTCDIRDQDGKYLDTVYLTYGNWTHAILVEGQTIDFHTNCYIRRGVKLGFAG